ncbi:MAG: hypothetical protein ACAI38_03215 [Myxococcota bacterium]|nr:hypothetical protein [Myxococcota bacterium]
MESAASIRANQVVAAFQASHDPDLCGVSDPAALTAVRGLIDRLGVDAQQRVDAHIKGLVAERKNPYRDKLVIGGQDVRFAARVRLLAAGELRESLRSAFTGLPETVARPDPQRVVSATLAALGELLKPHGYQVCGKDVGDGTELLEVAVRDPVYVAAAIDHRARELELLADEARSRGGMGIIAVARPEQVTALRGLIDDFCNASVATITTHFAHFTASGATPFTHDTLTLEYGSTVVPGRRVRSSEYGTWVNNAAVVRLERKSSIDQRLRELATDGLQVDREAFFKHLRQALAQRLATLPSLRAVAVTEMPDKTPESSQEYALAAVCVAKPQRSVAAFLRDVVRDFLPLRRLAALPPPMTKALPAPLPEVIPPLPMDGPQAMQSR